mgnify:CR=1 FL=1
MYIDIWCLSADQIGEKTSKNVEIAKHKENVKKNGNYKIVFFDFVVKIFVHTFTKHSGKTYRTVLDTQRSEFWILKNQIFFTFSLCLGEWSFKNVETFDIDSLISWDFGKSSIFASNTTEALTKLLIGTVFREKHVSEVCLWFRHFLDLKQKGFDTQGGYLELTRWFCGILVNAEHLRSVTVTGFEFEQFTPNCKLQNTTGTSKTFFFHEKLSLE